MSPVRGGRVLARRLVRVAAVVMFFVLGSVWAMGSADASALPQATLRFSSVQAFVKSLFADAVGLPGQASGTASGKGGDVSAKATRAGTGTGHAPGAATGELPAYSPTPRKVAAGKSATAHKGFDAKTSTRNARKSSALTDYFDNADGSYTVRSSTTPMNYQAADGTWQPIDTTLVKGVDGRWHAGANSFGVSFAPGKPVSGLTEHLAPLDRTSAAPSAAAAGTAPAAASLGQVADLTLGSGQAVGWSLSGANDVTASTSPDGRTVSYPGVLTDTTLTETSESFGVAESLVLSSASAPNSWTFPLSLTGVTLAQGAGNTWNLVSSTGAVVAMLGAPGATDSNIDPHTGMGASTGNVSYSLSTVGGVQQLTMTLDPAWLHDAARVFPVTVDPTVSIAGQKQSTYVDVAYPNQNYLNYSGEWQYLKIGNDGAGDVDRSFLMYPSGVADTGYHITAAQFAGFDQHAWNGGSGYGYQVDVAGGSWSPSSITWNNQPGSIWGVAGTWNGSPASYSTTCNNVSGRWEYTTLSASLMNTVSLSSTYYGFELVASSESDSNYWKILDSSQIGSCSPYLTLTYSPDTPPQVDTTAPASGYQSSTLTPTLTAAGHDPDSWPGGLYYDFEILDGANNTVLKDEKASCSTSGSNASSWTVPAGLLRWGQSYTWAVAVCDGWTWSPWTVSSLVTAVPPPLLTSGLSQDSSGHGFDPALGNYTTSATDAQVATVGPALTITRDYNSLDPRASQALGAGWSSILDAKAAEQHDGSGNVTSVTVTYPDGSEVGYGKNTDGSFAPPLGRFATFASRSGGGYTLTDKNDTVYTFAQALGSGVYGLSSVADAAARTLTVTWSSGQITTLTSASGRMLHLTWSTPSGAAYAHVSTVTTDPVTGGNQSTALVWKYFYAGDELASVCDPVQSGACTGASSDVSTKYAYTTGSQYRSAVLDGAPRAYWPLGEASGTSAADGVLANQHSLDATYTNVTLGGAGGLAGSTATAAVFNGSSSQASVSPTPPVLNTTSSFSVSAWVKLATTSAWAEVVTQDGHQDSGFFLEYDQPDGKWAFTRTSSDSGSTAVTRAESSVAPVAGAWTHLVGVYDANVGTLTLYVNGVASAPVAYSGAWSATGALVIGRNLWAGSQGGWLNGSVSDVSVYQSALPSATVAGLYQVGTHTTSLLTKITRPSGAVAAQIAYSPVTGRVTQVTDSNSGVWQVGAPSVSGSAEGYRAAVLGAAPSGYWRLGDAAGASTAYNEVAADGQGAVYNNVTLGTAQGPMTSPTAGVFDGSSSYVSLPQSAVPLGTAASVALWFNTTHAPGVLFEYQSKPLGQAGSGSGSNNYVNVYIGTDGKLHGGFFTVSGVPEMVSSGTVTDGNWHQVVLTATTGSGATQTLYLDGKQVAQLPGANFATIAAGSQIYLGAGTSGSGWPALPDLTDEYFNGHIAEAAFFQSAMTGSDVADIYNAAKNAAGLNPTETVTVTDPNTHPVTYEYDPVNGGRMIAQVDAAGAKTTYGYDSGGFLHTVVDPNGDETITGHDPRGNTLSKTTCQVQSTNTCSTQYYTYYPDDTTAVLSTPDPRNDMVLTSSDPRSSSSTDTTYQISYGYDARGDRTSVTTPPVAGYPAGRTATTTYTDGTATYPASDNASTGVPAGLPWTQTSAGGAVTQYHYDANGDVYSVTDPAGLLTCDGYDGVGQLATKTVIYTAGGTCASPGSSAQVTTYTYDGLGHPVTTTAPATSDAVTGAVHTQRTTVTYSPDGLVTQTVVADLTGGDASRTSTVAYNGLDQIQSSTDPTQATTGYTYNALGLQATVQNAAGDTTAYSYDNDGRLTYTTLKNYTGSPSGSQSAADLVKESRTYDPAGRLASVTDAMGYSTLYTYTDNGLTVQVTRCSAMTITGGVPTCTGSSYVQQSSSYDGAGNPVKQVTNNGATETDTAYDAAGRATSATLDPNGLKRTTTKSYTADDFVASQTTGDAGGSATTDYAYTPAGVMTSRSVENYTTGAPTGWWKLNDGTAGATTPSTARDWSGQNNTGTLSGGASWASGAASFNGSSGAITTGGPVVNTTASFSVSAWVDLAALAPTNGPNEEAASQDGTQDSAFMFGYHPATQAWWMYDPNGDSGTPGGPAMVTASNTAQAGTWTHLVAVYNASAGTISLYVNGALGASTTATSQFNATHAFVIGRALYAGKTTDFFNGQIANVQAYPRALSATDVSALYSAGRAGAALSASSNTTTWQVDPRGLATSMTDPDGNTTSYVYDADGHRVQTIAPTVTTGSYNTSTGTYTTAAVAPVSSTGYDTFGDVGETKDPDGNTTVYTYDADGRQTAATLPSYTQPGSANHATIAGAKSVTHYNALGQVDKSWDPAQTETDYSYDQLGHQTSATFDPTGLNRTATSVYDADGDALKTTDPSGAIQAATYDYLGRQLTATQVLGLGGAGSTQIPSGCQTYNNVATQAACTSTSQYTDTAGFLSQATSPAGVTTEYAYDAAGERTSVTDGANQTTITAYDFAGRPIKTALPDSSYSTVSYNAAGQQTATSQYDSTGTLLRTATASYDGNGNVLSTTDADANALIAQGKTGYSTTYSYDATGLLQSETQPVTTTSAITTSFGYDAAGHQTRYITGNDNAWYTTSNSWGLPEARIEPTTSTYTTQAASTFTTVYDTDGRPIEQDAPGGVVTTSSYDTAGETLTQSGTGAEAATATRSFTYYNNGLIKTAATSNTATSGSNATSESFAYDDSGALTGTIGSAGTSAFTYTADGQMASRADTISGTTYTTGYGYDTAGRLSTIADPLTGQTWTYGYTPNSLNYTITYGAGGDVRALTYNSAHELASDALTSGSTTVASITYGYDANGNETSKTTTGFTGAAANTYTYDQANRLTSWNNGSSTTNYSYDQDGNRTQVGANVFTYDARDQLTSDGVTSYAYTARGTLQSSTSTASGAVTTTADAYGQIQSDAADTYTYDALGRLAVENANPLSYSGTGNTLSYDGYTTYARDPSGALISDLQPGLTGRVDWTDQHTDVVGFFAPTATSLAGSVAYDPLGQVLSKVGHQTNLGYQSEYTRATTGKVNMAARWYNPATGQFTGKDTQANNPVPDSANANPFAYANDNPLTGTDPTGHCRYADDGFCMDTHASAADQASAGNTTVLANGNPGVHLAYAHYLEGATQKQFDDYVYKATTLPRTVSLDDINQLFRVVWNDQLAVVDAKTAPGLSTKLRSQAVGDANQQLQADTAALDEDVAQFMPTTGLTKTHCSANPLNWGGCVVNFVLDHPTLAGVLATVLTFVGCAAATGGLGSVGCAGAAGAAGSAVQQAGKCNQKGAHCTPLGVSTAILVGAVTGAVTAGVANIAAPVISSVVGDIAGDAVPSLVASGLKNGLTGAVAGAAGGTVEGAGGYLTQCGNTCSLSGLASAAVTGAATGGAAGLALGFAAGALGDDSVGAACHSFTGDTRVLMADGTAKPIDQIKTGDHIANSVPGQTGTQANTVTNIIVTKTDRDFVSLDIKPLAAAVTADSATAAGKATVKSGLKKAAVGLAAAVAAIGGTTAAQSGTAASSPSSASQSTVASPGLTDASDAAAHGGTLITTFTHPFYDITQAAFVEAQNLTSGDELQTPTGGAVVTSVRLYHANTVTYDLTIGALHTYYVVAGDTPVLVHNCGNGDVPAELDKRVYSNAATGRSDASWSTYDKAIAAAREHAGGDLGSDSIKMYDYNPATGEGTGTLIGEQTPDRLRGWRIDGQDGHVNWWDWTGGKKGAGGTYGHDWFPEDPTTPGSRYIGWAPWEDNEGNYLEGN